MDRCTPAQTGAPAIPTLSRPCLSQEEACDFLAVEPGMLNTGGGSMSAPLVPKLTFLQLQCPYAASMLQAEQSPR